MQTCKYPVVLVHGIGLKDFKFLRAFGRIEKILRGAGFTVYTAPTDGFGATESNAVQLKAFVTRTLLTENAEKVNLIAHSKGGLDCKYMIKSLGMAGKVASLTTLCTPHKSSPVASLILRAPKPVLKIIAFFINLVYRIFGDKRPDALRVCDELKLRAGGESPPKGVYCQSYSATLEKSSDDFVMGIPLMFSHYLESDDSDGLVSVDSSKFENYRGNCIDGSYSHSEMVDFMVKAKKRERIYAFYLKLCEDLAQKGF